jgi:hypothetical protein
VTDPDVKGASVTALPQREQATRERRYACPHGRYLNAPDEPCPPACEISRLTARVVELEQAGDRLDRAISLRAWCHELHHEGCVVARWREVRGRV